MIFNCYVYWIHLDNHSIEDGYVGVSVDPVRRFKEHAKPKKTQKRITEEIKSHGDDVIYDIIYCGTEESCYELEGVLRPGPYIGWNKARGGRFCPSKTLSGIKKSKPVWNKGIKIPRTEEENINRRRQWKEKKDSGYVHPNTNNVGKPSHKKGKKYPHLTGTGKYLTNSIPKKLKNTETGEIITVSSLSLWAKELSITTGNKFNTIHTYIRQKGRYKQYLVIDVE